MDYASKEDAIIFPYIKSLYTTGKIIDVGCKSGKWSLMLKDTIPEENWIMFDAIPAFINDLKRFWEKSELHAIALSDVSQKDRKFTVDKWHLGHSGFTHTGRSHINHIQVESKRLDEYNYKDVWFIKIDTEGHELPILKGAKDTILRNKPFLYFECYHKCMVLQEYTQKDLFDYVTSLGYVITNVATKKELSYEEFNKQTFSDKSTEHNFLARIK
ncbi:putative methyltransferase [Pelagibacter phage Mosig EXVC030M]|nr:putative methyltransferase [Pelagibacter phage Mosig EXVC030M]